MGVSRTLANLKESFEIAEIDDIVRRYFAINMFDGILAIIGILIASYFTDVTEVKIVISAAFAVAIAGAVSGIWGSYLTEMAERKGKIRSLEKKLSIRLKDSPIGKAHKSASLYLGLVDGILPLLATFIMISPLLFMHGSIQLAYYYSLAISFAFLFAIGAYLGKISKDSMILSGVKMLIVGVICAVIIFLLELILK